MKWVADPTGRFRCRPHYDRAELDSECERMVSRFLEQRHGKSAFPISTDDLTVMIEQDTSDLDLYADLSGEGEDVEGLTDFFLHRRPAVKLAQELSLDSRRLNRLRTTLAHEYGHVKFHTFLWNAGIRKKPPVDVGRRLSRHRRRYDRFRMMSTCRSDGVDSHPLSTGPVDARFLAALSPGAGPRCRRDRMVDAPVSDWMEWQASYICGAILMPLSLLGNLVWGDMRERKRYSWPPSDSDHARELVGRVAEAFDVSPHAAHVRLVRLGVLQEIQREDDLSRCRIPSTVSL